MIKPFQTWEARPDGAILKHLDDTKSTLKENIKINTGKVRHETKYY